MDIRIFAPTKTPEIYCLPSRENNRRQNKNKQATVVSEVNIWPSTRSISSRIYLKKTQLLCKRAISTRERECERKQCEQLCLCAPITSPKNGEVTRSRCFFHSQRIMEGETERSKSMRDYQNKNDNIWWLIFPLSWAHFDSSSSAQQCVCAPIFTRWMESIADKQYSRYHLIFCMCA